MASQAGIRAGRAYVELYTEQDLLNAGLEAAQRKLEAFGATAGSIGRAWGVLAAPVLGAGAFGIKEAAEAQKTLAKFQHVFGAQAEAAGAFADELAGGLGRARHEVQDSLATFQALFVGLGLSSEQARPLSQQMVRLSYDFASFNNMADPEAVELFAKALAGSTRGLALYGINLKEDAMKQELLNMGIAGGKKEASQAQEAIARVNLILRQMGAQGALGDAFTATGKFSNELKRLRAEVSETAEAIGNALLPVMTGYVGKLADVSNRFADWVDQHPGAVKAVMLLAGSIGVLSASLLAMQFVAWQAATAIKAYAFACGIATTASKLLGISAVEAKSFVLALTVAERGMIGGMATLGLAGRGVIGGTFAEKEAAHKVAQLFAAATGGTAGGLAARRYSPAIQRAFWTAGPEAAMPGIALGASGRLAAGAAGSTLAPELAAKIAAAHSAEIIATNAAARAAVAGGAGGAATGLTGLATGAGPYVLPVGMGLAAVKVSYDLLHAQEKVNEELEKREEKHAAAAQAEYALLQATEAEAKAEAEVAEKASQVAEKLDKARAVLTSLMSLSLKEGLIPGLEGGLTEARKQVADAEAMLPALQAYLDKLTNPNLVVRGKEGVAEAQRQIALLEDWMKSYQNAADIAADKARMLEGVLKEIERKPPVLPEQGTEAWGRSLQGPVQEYRKLLAEQEALAGLIQLKGPGLGRLGEYEETEKALEIIYQLYGRIYPEIARMQEGVKNVAKTMDEQLEEMAIHAEHPIERYKELQATINQLKEELAKPGGTPELNEELFDRLKRAQAEAQSLEMWPQVQALKDAAKFTTAGTFFGQALGQMGGGGPAERTAKATEKIVKNTDKTNEKLDELKLEFK